jgi:hypothetical protein
MNVTKKQGWMLLGAGCGAAVAIAGGMLLSAASASVRLPKTADEAVATLASGRVSDLDADRRAAWMEEARRLLRELDEEQRRALFQDEETRRTMGDLMRDRMDERARRFARGEELEWGPPGGFRPEDREAMRERFENMTEEERQALRDEMRRQAEESTREQFESGNAQSGGLQQEMFKRGGGGRRGGRGG